MEPLRILLVDDHIMFRKGVASLLSDRQDVQIVGEAGDGMEAVARARETVPDVILMDIGMPKWSGLEATRLIKQEMPHVKIVMLTVSDDERDLFTAIKYGAEGYLLKNLGPSQFFDMLEGVRRGEVAVSGVMAAKILKEFRQADQGLAQSSAESDALTPREVQVLELVVEGASNKEIAEALSVTEHTVKIHLRNILEKLHLHNRIQAAVYAVRQGLVGDSSPTQ